MLSLSPYSDQHSSTEYENVDDMQTERYDVHVHVHVMEGTCCVLVLHVHMCCM